MLLREMEGRLWMSVSLLTLAITTINKLYVLETCYYCVASLRLGQHWVFPKDQAIWAEKFTSFKDFTLRFMLPWVPKSKWHAKNALMVTWCHTPETFIRFFLCFKIQVNQLFKKKLTNIYEIGFHVAQDSQEQTMHDLELPILLPVPPECQGYRPNLLHVVLGIDPEFQMY